MKKQKSLDVLAHEFAKPALRLTGRIQQLGFILVFFGCGVEVGSNFKSGLPYIVLGAVFILIGFVLYRAILWKTKMILIKKQ